MTGTWKRGSTKAPKDLIKRYSVKRSAELSTFCNDLLATAHAMPNGRWYIEINDNTPFFRTGQGYESRIAGVKPGYYELFLPPEAYRGGGICGLAWRLSDKSLTILNKNGDLYSVERKEIDELIARSGLAANPNRDTTLAYVPVAVNNSSFVHCDKLAEGI